MADNIIETIITPDKPRVLDHQEIKVYVPKAGYGKMGVVKYDNRDFHISADGTVSVRNSFRAIAGGANPLFDRDVSTAIGTGENQVSLIKLLDQDFNTVLHGEYGYDQRSPEGTLALRNTMRVWQPNELIWGIQNPVPYDRDGFKGDNVFFKNFSCPVVDQYDFDGDNHVYKVLTGTLFSARAWEVNYQVGENGDDHNLIATLVPNPDRKINEYFYADGKIYIRTITFNPQDGTVPPVATPFINWDDITKKRIDAITPHRHDFTVADWEEDMLSNTYNLYLDPDEFKINSQREIFVQLYMNTDNGQTEQLLDTVRRLNADGSGFIILEAEIPYNGYIIMSGTVSNPLDAPVERFTEVRTHTSLVGTGSVVSPLAVHWMDTNRLIEDQNLLAELLPDGLGSPINPMKFGEGYFPTIFDENKAIRDIRTILRNFEVEGFVPPAEGWGYSYMAVDVRESLDLAQSAIQHPDLQNHRVQYICSNFEGNSWNLGTIADPFRTWQDFADHLLEHNSNNMTLLLFTGTDLSNESKVLSNIENLQIASIKNTFGIFQPVNFGDLNINASSELSFKGLVIHDLIMVASNGSISFEQVRFDGLVSMAPLGAVERLFTDCCFTGSFNLTGNGEAVILFNRCWRAPDPTWNEGSQGPKPKNININNPNSHLYYHNCKDLVINPRDAKYIEIRNTNTAPVEIGGVKYGLYIEDNCQAVVILDSGSTWYEDNEGGHHYPIYLGTNCKYLLNNFIFNQANSVFKGTMLNNAVDPHSGATLGTINISDREARLGYVPRVYSNDRYDPARGAFSLKDHLNGISDELTKLTISSNDEWLTKNSILGPNGQLQSGGLSWGGQFLQEPVGTDGIDFVVRNKLGVERFRATLHPDTGGAGDLNIVDSDSITGSGAASTRALNVRADADWFKIIPAAGLTLADDLAIPTQEQVDEWGSLPTLAQINTALAGKQNSQAGMGLSQENFTTAQMNKLNSLRTDAQLTTDLANKMDAEGINLTPVSTSFLGLINEICPNPYSKRFKIFVAPSILNTMTDRPISGSFPFEVSISRTIVNALVTVEVHTNGATRPHISYSRRAEISGNTWSWTDTAWLAPVELGYNPNPAENGIPYVLTRNSPSNPGEVYQRPLSEFVLKNVASVFGAFNLGTGDLATDIKAMGVSGPSGFARFYKAMGGYPNLPPTTIATPAGEGTVAYCANRYVIYFSVINTTVSNITDKEYWLGVMELTGTTISWKRIDATPEPTTTEALTGRTYHNLPTYVRRFTGNIVGAANTVITTTLIGSGITNIVSFGGQVQLGGQARIAINTSTAQNTFPQLETSNCLYLGNVPGALNFQTVSINVRAGTTNNAYDLWVEYTK